MSYVLITTAVLILLNVIAMGSIRRLVFLSNATSMQDKAQLIASSLSGLDVFTEENVAQTMSMLSNINSARILVTDPTGKAVYDTQAQEDDSPQTYTLLPEIVQALDGYDVVYCQYSSGAVESHAAVPVMNYELPVGAVYLMEYNTNQGALIASLDENLQRISIVLEGIVIVVSFLFSAAFSRRMNRVLESSRIVRAGDYSHNLSMSGHDELNQLADEFNALTERLQESEQRRREFVSNASHELKTPLASIKLLSDSILQNEMDPETIREFVQDIGNEADRLTRLSAKLLELTRVDAQMEEKREIVDVSQTVQLVLKMLGPQIAQWQLQVQTSLQPGATVLMLEDDLYQILFNLVENGIKYNKIGGSLLLRVQIQQEDVLLWVEDTGVGIPDESMEHIFERFYRVDKARSRKTGGAGLGLSIVHDMVERNYGTISVQHRQPEGTSFCLVFPLFAVQDETLEQLQDKTLPHGEDTP